MNNLVAPKRRKGQSLPWQGRLLSKAQFLWIRKPLVVNLKIPTIRDAEVQEVSPEVQCVAERVELNFHIGSIFGTNRLRGLITEPTDEKEDRKKKEEQPPLIQGSLDPAQAQAENESQEKSSNPFAHFYAWLYPPPEEVLFDVPEVQNLYAYQLEGVDFLLQRQSALLADDMGLGKTAQCAVALRVLFSTEQAKRALVICPKAITRQWVDEAKRWGGLECTRIDGPAAKRKSMWLWPGVLIATPNVVFRDSDWLIGLDFDIVVCDDIALLRNPGKMTKAIWGLQRERSWCLNGTPMANRPEEFACTMEFVNPGLFSPQEIKRAPSRKWLQERIAPYFLRRTKKDYLKDLPEKVKIGPISIELEGEQLRAYKDAEKAKWKALIESGTKITQIHIFSIITALIRLCSFHPPSGESAKLDMLTTQLDEALGANDEGTKAVVFSQSVETLKFLEEKLSEHSPLIYHGQMSDRKRIQVLNEFKADGRLLLISTKAGGIGLNLQHANYVFHFDRTWNPVDELQAEDRCWRAGQERTVFAARYCVVNTIEERIDAVLRRKSDLIDQYVNSMKEGDDSSERFEQQSISIEDLIEMVRPSGEAGSIEIEATKSDFVPVQDKPPEKRQVKNPENRTPKIHIEESKARKPSGTRVWQSTSERRVTPISEMGDGHLLNSYNLCLRRIKDPTYVHEHAYYKEKIPWLHEEIVSRGLDDN